MIPCPPTLPSLASPKLTPNETNTTGDSRKSSRERKKREQDRQKIKASAHIMPKDGLAGKHSGPSNGSDEIDYFFGRNLIQSNDPAYEKALKPVGLLEDGPSSGPRRRTDANTDVEVITPMISYAADFDGHIEKRMRLDVYLSHINFTDHRYFTREDCFNTQLHALYGEYLAVQKRDLCRYYFNSIVNIAEAIADLMEPAKLEAIENEDANADEGDGEPWGLCFG